MMDAPEIERRENSRERLEVFLRAHVGRWVSWHELAAVAGACAWRTRISELRRLKAMHIENKQTRVMTDDGLVVLSYYRYLDHTPLGRDAATQIMQKGLF